MYFDAEVAGDRTLVTSAWFASRLCTRADDDIAKVDIAPQYSSLVGYVESLYALLQ
jgi:hypothetical protein